jgi:hypothetical protein
MSFPRLGWSKVASRSRIAVLRLPAIKPGRIRLPAIKPARIRLPAVRPARIRLPRPGWPRVLRPATLAASAGWVLAGIFLFTCYLHISRTLAITSDGASNALQAWDMLHGNLLLRGWQLSDVSFATTELPEYMIIERLRGLRPDVVHAAAAMTYTLLLLLAALLAKGKARGKEAVIRILITAGIMLAPQLGAGISVLLLSPDHVGTAAAVMLTWILLDRAPRSWYVPPAAAALLAWALIADNIVLITGILPLATAGTARAYLSSGLVPAPPRLARRRSWFELSLAAMAVLAAWIARTAVTMVSSAGGYALWPVGNQLSAFNEVPRHVLLTWHGLLLLYGADFFSRNLGYAAALAMLHLVGLGLAAWALCAAWRRFAGHDLVVQILAIATVLNLAAYLFGVRAVDLSSTREIAAVLPYTAVLAGRLLAGRLQRAGLLPALAVVLTGYILSLSQIVAQPPAAGQNQQLASWLAAHRLGYGLAGYWRASSTTLDSSGSVRLRSVRLSGGLVARDRWEIQQSWYSPAVHDATFIVLAPSTPGRAPFPSVAAVRATFGQPARIYYVGLYIVLVWNSNLLTELG